MWVFLSARFRKFLLLAVAIPVARTLLRRSADGAARHNPDATTSILLRRADTTLSALTRRGRRENKRTRS